MRQKPAIAHVARGSVNLAIVRLHNCGAWLRRWPRTANGAMRLPTRDGRHVILQLWPIVRLFAGAGPGRRQYANIARFGEAIHMRAALMPATADVVLDNKPGGELISISAVPPRTSGTNAAYPFHGYG